MVLRALSHDVEDGVLGDAGLPESVLSEVIDAELIDRKPGRGEPADEIPLAVLADVVAAAEILPPLFQRGDCRIFVGFVDVGGKRHQHDAEAARADNPTPLAHLILGPDGFGIVLVPLFPDIDEKRHQHDAEAVRAENEVRERRGVVGPGGFGIVLVPLSPDIDETNEDPAITTLEERWKYFGGGDHVRQYGKRDFVSRLAAAGFAVDQLGIDYFGKDAFRQAGIAENSVLYVVRKGAEDHAPS